MALDELLERLGLAVLDKPLVTMGKIVIALTAIGCVLVGIIDFIEGFAFLADGAKSFYLFLQAAIWGSIKIVLGYGYFMLFDMSKSGLIVSIAKVFAILGAGIAIIVSQFVIIIGFLSLLNGFMGGLLLLGGCFMFFMGLGMIYFMDERDKFQKMKKSKIADQKDVS